jgi:hypothetical protein
VLSSLVKQSTTEYNVTLRKKEELGKDEFETMPTEGGMLESKVVQLR